MPPCSITHDALSALDSCQTVSDDQGGPATHQGHQRILHRALALRIEGGRRLVQQQDRRVAQDGTGDGDALALAA